MYFHWESASCRALRSLRCQAPRILRTQITCSDINRMARWLSLVVYPGTKPLCVLTTVEARCHHCRWWECRSPWTGSFCAYGTTGSKVVMAVRCQANQRLGRCGEISQYAQTGTTPGSSGYNAVACLLL